MLGRPVYEIEEEMPLQEFAEWRFILRQRAEQDRREAAKVRQVQKGKRR